MKLKKGVKTTLLALLAVGTFSIGSTFSYLTANKSVTNQFSVNKNDIKITEEYTPPTIVPGTQTFKKNIKVENNGQTPCYARVYIAFSDDSIIGHTTVSPNGSTFYNFSDFKTHLPANWVFIPKTTDARLGGYFYYTKPLAVGESTTSLTDSFKTTYDNADDIVPYEIYVYSESVQTLDKDGGTTFASSQNAGIVKANDAAYVKAWKEFLNY